MKFGVESSIDLLRSVVIANLVYVKMPVESNFLCAECTISGKINNIVIEDNTIKINLENIDTTKYEENRYMPIEEFREILLTTDFKLFSNAYKVCFYVGLFSSTLENFNKPKCFELYLDDIDIDPHSITFSLAITSRER